MLRALALRFTAQVRTVDRVARIGGEEFGVILMQADRALALEVAGRICAACRAAAVAAGPGIELSVTVSAGVAALPADASTAATLIAAADRALYAAKAAGRDRVMAARAV